MIYLSIYLSIRRFVYFYSLFDHPKKRERERRKPNGIA